jgi:ceramide glucosyltransferase
VILSLILGCLACLSLTLLLWQWVAALRFPLHQRAGDNSFAPAVTLLKPLKECDPSTEDCLRSWFTQQYAGGMQFLFAVASAEDPVCEVVRRLMNEYRHRDAQLVVCSAVPGANAKASKLAELEKLAQYEVLIISDADVQVPPDFLTNVVAPLRAEDGRAGSPLPAVSGPAHDGAHGVTRPASQTVGLVSCFYRLANPTTLAMQWEAIAVNADFWSQVLQSQSLKPLDFALGAVMVTRRRHLDEIGGFKSLAECLADDYQLGNRLARLGYRIALCTVVVQCWDPPVTWGSVWKHQLRWARTIRVCRPAPYFFSILSNATLWPLLWFVANPAKSVLLFACAAWGARVLAATHLQTRLAQSRGHWLFFWLVPVKDLLQVVIWFCAFTGNRIEWRRQRYRLRRDGTLIKA